LQKPTSGKELNKEFEIINLRNNEDKTSNYEKVIVMVKNPNKGGHEISESIASLHSDHKKRMSD
jgi:hypothetical protein